MSIHPGLTWKMALKHTALVGGMCVMSSQIQAQVKVDLSTGNVSVQTGTGSVAVNEVGTLGPDVQTARDTAQRAHDALQGR